jgi:tryptophan-rich sensory protein
MHSSLIFLGFFLPACLVAAIGAWVTRPAVRNWYPRLKKPPWTPPAWLFGPVWSALYVAMAVGGFLGWSATKSTSADTASLIVTLYAIQLALNLAWSVIFFGLKKPRLAATEIVVLWLAILATTIVLYNMSTVAGLLFTVYLLWVSFAAALNFAIWRRNMRFNMRSSSDRV